MTDVENTKLVYTVYRFKKNMYRVSVWFAKAYEDTQIYTH